jgi:hypothetical protein
MTLPPTFAAGALYDTLLQSALRQFFARATFETTPIPSVSSDGRLAIEPTPDPCALSIRWFGSRHTLRVPERRPFTPDEVRMARAIGAVLAARYRAIFDPRLMAEREDLFRGSIEDRYVGVFLEHAPYTIESTESRADRIASAIEVLRLAALSSYENRPISSGVLLLDADDDPVRVDHPFPLQAQPYAPALTAIKSFYRLSDGLHTVFLVNRRGLLFDIADIERWAGEAHARIRGAEAARQDVESPSVRAYRAHARATLNSRHVCVVLSPTHEIKVFANGEQVFTFRNARWHLLDLAAKYEAWLQAVGNRPLAERVFQTALDLADAREGALIVVLRDPAEAVPQLIAPGDRLQPPVSAPADVRQGGEEIPIRRNLKYLLAGQHVTAIDPSVLAALCRLDGATVTDLSGRLLAFGAILVHPMQPADGWVAEGARSTAAQAASRFGPVLKVSEDGIVSFYDGEKVWDI